MPHWDVASSDHPKSAADPSGAFGALLRKRRLERKMSQEALAARAGYERAFISLIDLGKTNPLLRSIFNVCGALEIRPSVFNRQVERDSKFCLPRSSD